MELGVAAGTSDAARDDRIVGTLLGAAVGDGLGAGYEFGSAPFTGRAAMIGGGLGDGAPGEWTDDTAMTVAVAEVTATGTLDLDAIAAGFLRWFADDPPDVGIQTRAVLAAAAGDPAAVAPAAAARFAAQPRSSAGNGALMRTAPVALAHLGDDAALATAARAVSDLTHADPLSGDACVLWCVAIDRAVREERLDGVRDGLALLPAERAAAWAGHLDVAETAPLAHLTPNGFVVTALQAAHAAVQRTPVPDGEATGGHLAAALHAVIGIGDDTDTTAAIAGALLGARWGASAIPAGWLEVLHGWPGLRAPDLADLARRTARPPTG